MVRTAYSTMLFLSLDPVRAIGELSQLTDTVEVNYENLHRMQVDSQSVLAYFRRALQEAVKLGLEPLAIHAPYEEYFLPYLAAGLRRMVDEARLLIDVVAGYDVRYIVFHPFSGMRVGFSRVEWLNKFFFAEVADHAKGYGITVAVENTVWVKPWNRVENVISMVKAVASNNLGMCLDTGHAWVNGYNPATILETSRDIVKVLHVHDNRGRSDEHLTPGAGTIDWNRFREALRSLNAVVVPEVACTESIETCKARALVAKKVIEWIVGK